MKSMVVLFSLVIALSLPGCSSGVSETSSTVPPPPTAGAGDGGVTTATSSGPTSSVPPPPAAKMPEAPASNFDDMNPHSAKPTSLQGRKTIVVARQTIPEGYPIKTEIVAEQLVFRTDVPSDVPASASLVVGRTTKRTIPSGQALQWSDIITKPTVVVAKYFIADGTAITSDLVEIKESENKEAPGDAIKDKSQVTGRKATRNIQSGETLVDGSLTPASVH